MKRAYLGLNTNTYEQNHASSIRSLKNNFVRMKHSIFLFLFLLIIPHFCLAQMYGVPPLDSFLMNRIHETANELGLKDNYCKEKYRLWNHFYVLEIEKVNKEKYYGTITFYIHWGSDNYKDKGVIYNKINIAPDKVQTLFNILNDSIEIKNRLKKGEEISINDKCTSFIEYTEFTKGIFCYYLKPCDACEDSKCVKKIQPYVKFIDSLCDKDMELSNLLKKLPNNVHGSYSSMTTCCCGHEF